MMSHCHFVMTWADQILEWFHGAFFFCCCCCFFFFFYHLLSLLSSGGKAFNKLKKVGKTTRPFRYDVNPIPYDYTVDVRNRFKGLDLTDRVPAELWTEVVTLYRRQRLRPSPWKKNWGTYTRMTSPKFNWKRKKKMPLYLICSNFKLLFYSQVPDFWLSLSLSQHTNFA